MISLIAFPVLVAVIYASLTAVAKRRLPPGAEPLQLAASFRPVPPPPREEPPPPEPVHHATADRSERELLDALRENPGDADTRLVYADWLESRGELVRADFVRGAKLDRDQQDVLATLDRSWRALASCAPIACSRSACPRRWSALRISGDDDSERSCHACGRVVRHCVTLRQAHDARERGELVADDVVLPRIRPEGDQLSDPPAIT